MRKTAKLLLIAVAFTLAITACNDEDPERILWEVAAAPSENVEAFASPDFHPSRLISAADANGFTDTDCGFTLARVSANEFKITFDEWEPAEPGKDYYRYVHFFTISNGTSVSSSMIINRIN